MIPKLLALTKSLLSPREYLDISNDKEKMQSIRRMAEATAKHAFSHLSEKERNIMRTNYRFGRGKRAKQLETFGHLKFKETKKGYFMIL